MPGSKAPAALPGSPLPASGASGAVGSTVGAPAERAAPPAENKPGGPPDFISVLEQAGVTIEQRTRVGKAQDLLKSLPAGATPELKRQIVEVAFRAFDIPTREIVRAATAQIDALKAFIEAGERVRYTAVEQGNNRIKDLERQIAEVRAQMDEATAAQQSRELTTRKEIAKVEPVLDFFLLDDAVALDPLPPSSGTGSGREPMPAPSASPPETFEMPAPLSGVRQS